MKKIISVISIIFFVVLAIYPTIEFKNNDKLYKFSYTEDFGEFEENMCFSESFSYNKKRNISINKWRLKKFLVFKVFILDYEDGNICDSEYLLEESYIKNFLDNAKIEYNDSNINLSKLIYGKKAIVSNTRYYTEDEKYYIGYTLNDKYEDMYVFYVDNLLVIQVGLSDEGPKFIAYK